MEESGANDRDKPSDPRRDHREWDIEQLDDERSPAHQVDDDHVRRQRVCPGPTEGVLELECVERRSAVIPMRTGHLLEYGHLIDSPYLQLEETHLLRRSITGT